MNEPLQPPRIAKARLPIDALLREPCPLPANGRPRAPVHVFDRDSILAVNTALACGRPLLVRGEPGAGKSQLARAVATAMQRVFVSKFVDARTEAHDLLWYHDAVARLAKAQAMARPTIESGESTHASERRAKVDRPPSELLALASFVVPGPLWWALNWKSAEAHIESLTEVSAHAPKYEPPCSPNNGVVLLIDEIDKANSSVPNGLLEALGQGTFDVPGLAEPIEAADPAPLVLLTTNEDRVLPDAFVRRCVVLHLELPPISPGPESKAPRLFDWLVERGRAHFGSELSTDVDERAAARLVDNRLAMDKARRCPPGLAEYIDLLTALADDPTPNVDDRLDEIGKFLLNKHPSPIPRTRR